MSNETRDRGPIWHPFTPMSEWLRDEPLVIARGEGSYLIDVEGRRYLDAVSSLWVTVHGHNHPVLNEALHRQIEQVAHSTLLGLTHPRAIELAEQLVAITPDGLSRVFYSDSGSTAVEIALKQAFQFWSNSGQPQRQHFVHLTEAYHGDTLGAVGVGGVELFHRIFGPLIVAGIPTPAPILFPNPAKLAPEEIRDQALRALEQILQSRAHEIAAIVVEPLVQGAAGMLVHPPGYLAGVARLARAFDVLLIVDEVATGFGRTGTMFACEQEKVSPDFLCVAKGLTGGYLPLAATLTTDRIFDAFLGERREYKTFFHGHTYTGNPLACAVALASLKVFHNEDVLSHVRAMSEHLTRVLDERMRPSRFTVDVRQKGLMVGIELGHDGQLFPVEQFVGNRVCQAARKHGVILRPLGDVLVWMPPLCIKPDQLDDLAGATLAAIEEVCPVAATS